MPNPRQPTGIEEILQPSPHDLQIGLASHPGCVRERNEDSCLAFHFSLAQRGEAPLPVGLFVVADGMGGHSLGEQASALACKLAAEHVIRQVCLPLLAEGSDHGARTPINEVLESSVQIAHQAVVRRLSEAGTTLTMALLLGDGVYIAHVGDSRAYLGEKSGLLPLTRDHSMAARLLEMGQATEKESEAQRNILYKALGRGPHIEPDVVYHGLKQGQYLLLCCDGLWGELSDEEMAEIVNAASTPDIACQRLVTRATEKGGEDNITVVLATRGWPPEDGGKRV
jgi:serine/threonine protein phosphatase PrpC